MKNNQNGFVGVVLAVVGVFLLIALPLILNVLYVYGTQQDRTFTINKSERITNSDGQGSKYLVFTESGVYQNKDSILRLKFNSSDVYNQLKEGKTYECDTFGWRIPFFSTYPNIVSCEEKQ